MAYVLFYAAADIRPQRIRTYADLSSARRGMRTSNRNAGFVSRVSRCWNNKVESEWCEAADGTYTYGSYAVMNETDFEAAYNQKVTVKSLLSGKEVEIREQDRGGCCDPSTETFWSM
jgi:uncharacterized protein (DUF39 family)